MTQPLAPLGRLVSATQAAEAVAAGQARLIRVGSGTGRLHPQRDLWDETRGDYLTPEVFAALCTRIGLTPGRTPAVFADAGDGRDASLACWTFCHLGHTRAAVLNGGCAGWSADAAPHAQADEFSLPLVRNASVRAGRQDVATHVEAGRPLVDARSPAEFAGVLTDAPDKPQIGIRQGGHVPGALNIPWRRARAADGRFASKNVLQPVYQAEHGLRPDDDLIVYSRTARRAAGTWLVLTALLGFRCVRVYDGGWAEWGNLVGVPIAR